MDYDMTSKGAYSTIDFINTILSFSFKSRQYISRDHLNRIAYIAAYEYSRITGKKIIDENFNFETLCPKLQTVNSAFCRSFDFGCIQHFIKQDEAKVKLIEDPKDLAIIKKVWRETCSMSLIEFTQRISNYRRNELLLAS